MSPYSSGLRPRLPGIAAAGGGLRATSARPAPTGPGPRAASDRGVPRSAASLFRPGWAGPAGPFPGRAVSRESPAAQRPRAAAALPVPRGASAVWSRLPKVWVREAVGSAFPGGDAAFAAPSIPNRTPEPLEMQLLCPVLSTKSIWIGQNCPGYGWDFAAGYSYSSPQLPVPETVHLGTLGVENNDPIESQRDFEELRLISTSLSSLLLPPSHEVWLLHLLLCFFFSGAQIKSLVKVRAELLPPGNVFHLESRGCPTG